MAITTIRGAWRWKTQKSILTRFEVGQREPAQQDARHRHDDQGGLVPAVDGLALVATVLEGVRVHGTLRHVPILPPDRPVALPPGARAARLRPVGRRARRQLL